MRVDGAALSGRRPRASAAEGAEDQSQALLVLTAPPRTEGYEKLQLLAVLGHEHFAGAGRAQASDLQPHPAAAGSFQRQSVRVGHLHGGLLG